MLAAAALAALAAATPLPSRPALRIDGAATGDRVGSVVADAGDVNGDGRQDVILGVPAAHPHGTRSGSAYVVLGGSSGRRIGIGARGLRIDGAEREARAGFAVAGAGDVNGDGLDDVVVGASGGTSGIDTVHDGAAFVVYGTRSPATVDLGHLGPAGFRISGSDGGQLGFSVDGAGDVNGDGLADVIAGDPNGGTGHAYVVFGSRVSADVNADALGARGFSMARADHAAGFAVAGAGDLNGDGAADVAVTDAEETGPGAGYVVFGGPSTAPVDLAAPGARGVRIDGIGDPDATLDSVAGAGDVDGDGRPDLVFGSEGASQGEGAGSAWVVFGSPSTAAVRLAHLGRRGFRIRGVFDELGGGSVDGAGDVNGDGRADVVVGARGLHGVDRGAAYVVFGRRSTSTVNLGRLGRAGLRIAGPTRSGRAGWSVAGVPNADGNHHDGVLVGAPYVAQGGHPRVGAAYLYVSRRRAGA